MVTVIGGPAVNATTETWLVVGRAAYANFPSDEAAMLSVGAGRVGGQNVAPFVQFVLTLAAAASLRLSITERLPSPEPKTRVVLFAPGTMSDGALPAPEATLAVS